MSSKIKDSFKFWNSSDTLFLLSVFFGGFILIWLSKGFPLVLADSTAKWIVAINQFFALLLKETGVALMIAAALGYTVEAITRKKQAAEFNEFQQKISEDVLSAVFKKIIPDAIFKEVKRSVLDQTLIKIDSSMTYELSPFTKELAAKLKFTEDEWNDYKDKILVCDVTTSHKLRNLSDISITNHPIRCGVSCDLDEKFRDGLKIHKAVIGQELSSEELEKCMKDGKGQGVKEFHKSIDIGKEDIEISFCSRTFKKIEDTEVWTTLTPTENMELEVGFPHGIEVGAKSNHPEALFENATNPNVSRIKFELNHGVFPYQGITFWWHKKKPKVTREPEQITSNG